MFKKFEDMHPADEERVANSSGPQDAGTSDGIFVEGRSHNFGGKDNHAITLQQKGMWASQTAVAEEAEAGPSGQTNLFRLPTMPDENLERTREPDLFTVSAPNVPTVKKPARRTLKGQSLFLSHSFL